MAFGVTPRIFVTCANQVRLLYHVLLFHINNNIKQYKHSLTMRRSG